MLRVSPWDGDVAEHLGPDGTRTYLPFLATRDTHIGS
jgi:hypothetical protein